MPQQTLPVLFELQRLVVDLAYVNRHHYLAGHERSENDIEHSFAVAMLCWYICDTQYLDLDIAKILKYALVHDFVERYAGDVSTFASREARLEKVRHEKVARERLSKEFKSFPDLVSLMNAYETTEDEESLFVWTVDKMQAYIMGDLDAWRPYKKLGITYEQFIQKHSEQLAACSPYCKQIFESLLSYVRETYYQQPSTS